MRRYAAAAARISRKFSAIGFGGHIDDLNSPTSLSIGNPERACASERRNAGQTRALRRVTVAAARGQPCPRFTRAVVSLDKIDVTVFCAKTGNSPTKSNFVGPSSCSVRRITSARFRLPSHQYNALNGRSPPAGRRDIPSRSFSGRSSSGSVPMRLRLTMIFSAAANLRSGGGACGTISAASCNSLGALVGRIGQTPRLLLPKLVELRQHRRDRTLHR